jgi:hypothetical protein
MTLKYLLIIDFPKFDPLTAAEMALCGNLGPTKKFPPKSYYLCITNNEIVQHSKMKPKNSHSSCVPLSLVKVMLSAVYVT